MAGSLVGKILNLMGFEEMVVEDVAEGEDLSSRHQVAASSGFGRPKVVSLPSAPGAGGKVVVNQPKNFDEARNITDHLKARRTVVVNLEGAEEHVAQRIVDFVSGAVYALNGTMERVGSGIFLFAPSNVAIMAPHSLQSDNDEPWSWLGS
ncbi:MAG: cell division protein SepF [Firmicutes bacterium]|nr:cell division protein SepF [Bacillota bacterium]